MRIARLLGFLIVLVACCTVRAESYDVVIAGAGSGGVAAAIQAARMGMNVALLEETEYIGGQMGSAGVSNMDEGFNLTPPSGFYKEFLSKMQAYYDERHQSIATCYWNANSHCFEPVGVRRVLTAMIDETNRSAPAGGHIALWLRERVIAVQSAGKTVTGATTVHHGKVQSKILIDATEWGDVLPLTPAKFRAGNQVGTPTHASCTQDITYTMVIKKYAGGVPAALVMQHAPPDYEKYVAQWRLKLQKNGNPDNRWQPVSFAQHNAYRGMPDPGSTNYVSLQPQLITKTGVNWFNDFPVTTDVFDRAKRQQLVCAAKLKTIGNLYYIQHELGETQWSVANDQEYDSPYQREENLCPNIPAAFKAIERNMPQAVYVRESERIIGKHKLRGWEIRRESQGGEAVKHFPSSIAVGDYADDLHNCHEPEDFEHDLDSEGDDPPGFRSGPFQVPFGALIPEEVNGLLAAEKNISVSRLASGATRLQPITMLTGQAAGALAAMSIRQGVIPRAVDWTQLQLVLLRSGSILASAAITDLPQGTLPWQAAQLAVTHKWMEATDGKFRPTDLMTRAQAVTLIAIAYDLSQPVGTFGPSPRQLMSSFSDVPLYSEASAPVEAFKSAGIALPCRGDAARFCGEDRMTRESFLSTVQALEAKKRGDVTVAALGEYLRADKDAAITRGEAALVLYQAVAGRAR